MKINNLDRDYPKAWAKMIDFFEPLSLRIIENEYGRFLLDILDRGFDMRDLEGFFDRLEIITQFGYSTRLTKFECKVFDMSHWPCLKYNFYRRTRLESRQEGFKLCFQILEERLNN